MAKVVTFGEIMARLTPEGFLRFSQSMPGSLNVTFAGAEANVAVAIASLGGEAVFVSALPNHAIADACIVNLKGLNVDTRYVVRTEDGRLGLYFLETGANQRPSNVIYDRAGSSISVTKPEAYPWKNIFEQGRWFHVTGITPAISEIAGCAVLEAVKEAQSKGVTVSCDLNFRKKLWRWDPLLNPRDLAEKTMRSILPYVDVLIANEEDAANVLGIRANNTDVDSGQLFVDGYIEVARTVVSQFGNISKVAITLRESISASTNNWGAVLYDARKKTLFRAPCEDGQYSPYHISNIVDRVGAGDSFAAGLIFALTTPDLESPDSAIAFAAASSCLAHSIKGDFNYSSRDEVENLMRGSRSGRIAR